MNNYIQKYLKYKQKYQLLKGGAKPKRTEFYFLSYNKAQNEYEAKFIEINSLGKETNGTNTYELKENELYFNDNHCVTFSDDKYTIYCNNPTTNIKIEIIISLDLQKFHIKIYKKNNSSIIINLFGTTTFKYITKCIIKEKRLKFIINDFNVNSYDFIHQFDIKDKTREYFLKDIINNEFIKQYGFEKIDNLLFDESKLISIKNIFYKDSININNNFVFFKVMLIDVNKILVYIRDKNQHFYFNPITLSITTIDNNKLFEQQNGEMISYFDSNYIIHTDNTSKITKIIYKNCTINATFTYRNRDIIITSLDNLTINKIIITLSNFSECILTDIIKAKYDINEISSNDPFLQSILLYLNREDPKLNNLKDVTIDQITNTIYDYEKEYDIFRDNNMNTFCMGQNILFKSIYNSLFNLFYIENRDEINKLRNTNILITTHYIRKKLLIKFESIKCDLHKICNTPEDKDFLLQNIPKKIITKSKDFEIFSNKASSYIDFPPLPMKLIFDTGNASTTIIGIDLVEELGLIAKDTFVTGATGIGGDVEYEGKYVTVKLKFKSNTPYYIKDKEYEFNAIIDHKSPKTLLLGQSSQALKKFFEDNYCIVYDNSKQEYDSEYDKLLKSIMSNIQEAQQINKMTPPADILAFIHKINRKSNVYTTIFLDNDLLKTLFDELKNAKFKQIIPYIERHLDLSDINVNISYVNYILGNYKLLKTIFTKEDLKSLIQKLNDTIPKLVADSSNNNLIDAIKKLK
jgi:hypothetical protein